LEAKEIIEHVQKEQSDLKSKCISLESQRDWQEQERLNLKSIVNSNELKLKEYEDNINKIENDLENEKNLNTGLQELLNLKSNQIDNKNKKMIKKDEELEVLYRSLSTKDRQFQTLVKERNRLRDELTEKKKLNLRPTSLQQSRSKRNERIKLTTPEKSNENDNNNRLISSSSSSESFIEEVSNDNSDINNTPNGVNDLLLSPQDIRLDISTNDAIQDKDVIDLIHLESGDKKERRFYIIIKKLQNELKKERNITKKGGYVGDNIYKKPNVTLLSPTSPATSSNSLKKTSSIVKSLFK
jgi:chromosome segregation ATPase